MAEISTKPYLLRALYEWCGDSGLTPYLAVVVDQRTVVPRSAVRNGEIVLNVSHAATNRLRIGNELIEFQARFNGVAHELSIPIDNVSAIYAKETGHGMAFEVVRDAQPVGAAPQLAEAGDAAVQAADGADHAIEPRRAGGKSVRAVKPIDKDGAPERADLQAEDDVTGDPTPLGEPPESPDTAKRRGGGRARLTRIK